MRGARSGAWDSLLFKIIGIFIIGVVLCAFGYSRESGFFAELSIGLGTAIIIASVLAATLDYYFKRMLLIDAFKAVFGYVLPEYFREELNRIAQTTFIAERARLELSIDIIDQDVVRATWSSYRDMINIADSTQIFHFLIGLDDFGFPGWKSQIHECRVRLPNGTDEKHPVMESGASSAPGRSGKLESEIKDIKIPPKGTFSVYQKISEIYRTNATSYWVYFEPCRNPEIRITCPENMEYLIEFLHPNVTKQQLESGLFKLSGTFLARQPIIVRWWPKGFKAREHC